MTFILGGDIVAKIRIISAPAGQAPKWVREQWVGLEFSVQDVDVSEHKQRGVLGGVSSPYNLGGYPIDSVSAVETLATKSPEAAKWFKDNVPLDLLPTFVFGKQFCILVME